MKKYMITKTKLHQAIDTLPENMTIDQAIEELILLDKIEHGINDVDKGNVYTTDEVKNKLNKWLK